MLAYHVVVRALEGRAGLSPLRRLWSSIEHAIDGHLPYERYQAAGFARAGEGASSSEIERWVFETLATDLNPAGQIGKVTASVETLVDGYNTYNRRTCLGVRTTMSAPGDSREAKREFVYRRDMLSAKVDPEPCRLGSLTVFRSLVSQAANRKSNAARTPTRATEVAKVLGAQHSATAQVAEVFESEGAIDIRRVAARLGCSVRTLERRLRDEGGTAEQVRMACRLVKTQELMAGDLSLTQVAFEAGFSDSAHLSRVFKAATGITPSEYRGAVVGTSPRAPSQ
jgi:AraC-like DNA-binding protein